MRRRIFLILKNKWMLFILVSLIYLTLSGMASFARHENLETIIVSANPDYHRHTVLSVIIASGVSPYSTNTCFYKTFGIIPGMYCQYTGYNTLNAILINFTALSAEEVVYVVNPFLFNLFLIFSIFVACKILGFGPIEAVSFLILYNFVNDPNAIFSPVHAMGEVFGNGLGLIGVALFLKRPANLSKIKSYLCVPFLVFAVILHISNLAFIAILTIFTVLCIFLSFVTKKEYSHNYKHLVFLALAGLLIIPYMIPIFTPVKGTRIIPYCDVGQNVVDPIKNPPQGIFITRFLVSEKVVKINQPVDIFVELVNTKNTSEDYMVNLTINSVFEDNKTVFIPSGRFEKVTFIVTKQDLGVYTCVVNTYGVIERFEVVSSLLPLNLKPAIIGVDIVEIIPEIAKVDEPINISVKADNYRGEQTGTRSINLMINGIIEQTKNVTLKPKEYKIVTFTVTKGEIGKYYFIINTLSGQFEVMYNPPPVIVKDPDVLSTSTIPIIITPIKSLLVSGWQGELYDWLRPKMILGLLVTFGYPLLNIYYGTATRGTIGVIIDYLGYNFTFTDFDLNSINTSSIVPISLALAFNIGIPLLFIMTIVECFRKKERNKSVLVFSAYSLIICLSFLCLISGLFFIPHRFIKYSVLFWIIFLVKSNIWSKIKIPISIFFISRSVLWILALSSIGGLII